MCVLYVEKENYRFAFGPLFLSAISIAPVPTTVCCISITVTRGRYAQQVLMGTIAAMTAITTGPHAVDRLRDRFTQCI